MYRVITDSAALDQLAALPTSALPCYAEALGVLEFRPMRELVFGAAGQGTITYLLLEREGEVHVLLVQWLG